MANVFPIVDCSTWTPVGTEPMGSKQKIWLSFDQRQWLFKEPKQPGEDWAEKSAAEIAGLLGLPHASVDLASRNGRIGVLSKNFVGSPANFQLVHGNELMADVYEGYQPKGSNWKTSQHTVDRVFDVLARPFVRVSSEHNLPVGVASARELFCGYLLFDAFIGNTDLGGNVKVESPLAPGRHETMTVIASTRALFVAWQHPDTRRFYPVARLAVSDGDDRLYEFTYIHGALEAAKVGFRPFLAFPDLQSVYRNTSLFPFFTNRLMARNRPDFPLYVAQLGLDTTPHPKKLQRRGQDAN